VRGGDGVAWELEVVDEVEGGWLDWLDWLDWLERRRFNRLQGLTMVAGVDGGL